MEGGGTRLERKTDVGCLGQRKGEAARRKKERKQSKLGGTQAMGFFFRERRGKEKEISGGFSLGGGIRSRRSEREFWEEGFLLPRVTKGVESVA